MTIDYGLTYLNNFGDQLLAHIGPLGQFPIMHRVRIDQDNTNSYLDLPLRLSNFTITGFEFTSGLEFGSDRAFAQPVAGQARVFFYDPDADFNRHNHNSVFNDNGIDIWDSGLNLRIEMPRIQIQVDSVNRLTIFDTFPLWEGRIDEVIYTPLMDGGRAEIVALGPLADYARAEVNLTAETGSVDFKDAIEHAVRTVHGIPSGSIDDFYTTSSYVPDPDAVMPIFYGTDGSDALRAMQAAAVATGGILFEGRRGKLRTFSRRQLMTSTRRIQSQCHISDRTRTRTYRQDTKNLNDLRLTRSSSNSAALRPFVFMSGMQLASSEDAITTRIEYTDFETRSIAVPLDVTVDALPPAQNYLLMNANESVNLLFRIPNTISEPAGDVQVVAAENWRIIPFDNTRRTDLLDSQILWDNDAAIAEATAYNADNPGTPVPVPAVDPAVPVTPGTTTPIPVPLTYIQTELLSEGSQTAQVSIRTLALPAPIRIYSVLAGGGSMRLITHEPRAQRTLRVDKSILDRSSTYENIYLSASQTVDDTTRNTTVQDPGPLVNLLMRDILWQYGTAQPRPMVEIDGFLAGRASVEQMLTPLTRVTMESDVAKMTPRDYYVRGVQYVHEIGERTVMRLMLQPVTPDALIPVILGNSTAVLGSGASLR